MRHSALRGLKLHPKDVPLLRLASSASNAAPAMTDRATAQIDTIVTTIPLGCSMCAHTRFGESMVRQPFAARTSYQACRIRRCIMQCNAMQCTVIQGPARVPQPHVPPAQGFDRDLHCFAGYCHLGNHHPKCGLMGDAGIDNLQTCRLGVAMDCPPQ